MFVNSLISYLLSLLVHNALLVVWNKIMSI